MQRGRPKAVLLIPEEDRSRLLRWSKRPKSSNGLARRADIVLRCADGLSNSTVAAQLRITPQTVGKWRSRYIERGLAGLLDEPRPGAPRRITDDQVEAVVVKTLESTPRDATHWSTREMAKAVFVNPFETPGGSNQLVSITSSAGRLIHAGPGSCGGSGALRTKRSGCAA